MQLGTARIKFDGNLWIVTWRNIGNCLQPLPRHFFTVEEAWAFCRERGLRVQS
jgi:hypothetical protein